MSLQSGTGWGQSLAELATSMSQSSFDLGIDPGVIRFLNWTRFETELSLLYRCATCTGTAKEGYDAVFGMNAGELLEQCLARSSGRNVTGRLIYIL